MYRGSENADEIDEEDGCDECEGENGEKSASGSEGESDRGNDGEPAVGAVCHKSELEAMCAQEGVVCDQSRRYVNGRMASSKAINPNMYKRITRAKLIG